MTFKKVLVSTLGTAAVIGASFFATTSANADVRVTVKSGDTVSKIATQYKSTVSAIKSANGLKNANLIYVGESLVIPSSASTSQTTTAQATQTTPTTTQQTQTTGTTQGTSAYQGTVSHYASNQQANTNTTRYQAPTTTTTQTQTTGSTGTGTSNTSSSSSSAKAWIANKESGGSYSARNGQYIGKYQLSASYLNGDYSAANQEKVANQYVSSRYGSWSKAKAFWQANGWY